MVAFRIVKVVDDALQLSQSFRLPVIELGQIVVLFVFTLVSSLVDAIVEDFSLQLRWSEEQYKLTGNMGQHDMTMEVEDDSNSKRHEHRENLRRTNIVVVVDMEVRVRFAGFGVEEDEWVNVRKCVRQCSLPFESSECVAVLSGDLILCFQHFESFVREHFHQRGHYILGACNAYMMGAQA